MLAIAALAAASEWKNSIIVDQPSSNQGVAHSSARERVEVVFDEKVMLMKIDNCIMNSLPPGRPFLSFHF